MIVPVAVNLLRRTGLFPRPSDFFYCRFCNKSQAQVVQTKAIVEKNPTPAQRVAQLTVLLMNGHDCNVSMHDERAFTIIM